MRCGKVNTVLQGLILLHCSLQTHALRIRQAYGTDWTTQTVYITLAPGSIAPSPVTQTAIVTQAPSGVPYTVTTTIWVTQPTVISTKTETLAAGSTTCWWDCDGSASPSVFSSPTSQPPPVLAISRPCLPGDQNERVTSGPLQPTRTQTATLIAIGVYLITIFVGWSLIGIRTLLYPIKLLVTAWHELGHTVGVVASGSRLKSVSIDPNEGGMITTEGGDYPRAALYPGYIFNIIIGGLLTFAGFDTLASKVSSFFIGLSLLVVAFWAAGLLSKLLVAGALALMIGLWFIDHASELRYYILFIGVMSSWFVLFDTADDLVFRKPRPCCARLFNLANPRIPLHVWALIWLGISFSMFILFILAGLAAWRLTSHGMYCQSQQFLPT